MPKNVMILEESQRKHQSVMLFSSADMSWDKSDHMQLNKGGLS